MKLPCTTHLPINPHKQLCMPQRHPQLLEKPLTDHRDDMAHLGEGLEAAAAGKTQVEGRGVVARALHLQASLKMVTSVTSLLFLCTCGIFTCTWRPTLQPT
mgnify:CR=1 FL=1